MTARIAKEQMMGATLKMKAPVAEAWVNSTQESRTMGRFLEKTFIIKLVLVFRSGMAPM